MIEEVEVPEGWRRVRLGEVLFVINQKNKQVKTTEYQNIGLYPIVDQSEKKISGFYDNIKKVITVDLPIVIFGDHTRIVKYIDFPFIPGADGTQILKPLEKVDIFFFYYLIVKASEQIGNYGYDRHLKYLKEHYILFPTSLSEQRKIAEILETVDNAIGRTDTIIEKYKRIKHGLMQDLLTRGVVENDELGVMNYELRDEKKHGFKDSPLGRIPVEWEACNISDFAEINPSVNIENSEFYPFIEMDATPIMGKQYNYLSYRKGTEAGSKFKAGDILLARITPCAENGKSLLVPKDIAVGIGSTEFIVFRAREKVETVFLFYLLISDFVRNIAIGLMEGTSGRQRIPNYVFEQVIKVAIPKSLEEQHRIASVLSQTDETIEKEQKYKQKLEKIKQGLMEDLLSGKVRVNHLIKEGMKNVQSA